MCFCCGILETLALCAGLKVMAVCRKKKCECPRPHEQGKGIKVIPLEEPEVAYATAEEKQNTARKRK